MDTFMRLIFLLILLLPHGMLFAQTTPSPLNAVPSISNAKTTQDPEFNIADANKEFDQINLKLSTQNLNIKDLSHAIKSLQHLSDQAQECVDETQKKLNNINTLIIQNVTPNDATPPSTTTPTEKTADQLYFQKEVKKLNNAQAQCRLFKIRASEAIFAYQTTVAELKKEETFSKSSPIWKTIPKLMQIWQTHNMFPPNLNLQISDLEIKNWLFHALISIFLSLYLLYKILKTPSLMKVFRIKHEHTAWMISSILTLWMTFNWIWCYLHESVPNFNFHTCDIFKVLLILSGLFSLNVLIFSMKRTRAIFIWYGLDFNYFYQLFNTALVLALIAETFKWSKLLINYPKIFIHAAQSVYLWLALFCCLSMIFHFFRLHFHYNWVRKYKKRLKSISVIYVFTCILTNLIGYHILAMHLFYSSITIIAILFASALLLQAVQKIYSILTTEPIKLRLIHIFGYHEGKNLKELYILKLCLQITILAFTIYFIGLSMGFVSFYIEKFYQPILNGIVFDNFTIYPARIVLAIMVFCIVFLFCKALSTFITHYYQFDNEEDTQLAVVSILNYLAFALALILGLLTSGFNFTGLAIVAGALSVGIGLGLQSIVNNFVSGLILLIEKPLKPGDRINVDGVEGTVKKIRVRSTLIITPNREDIIVPNSDLITRRVTNYMYTDKYLTIFCEIQVHYESNVELVKKLLLDVAAEHEEVIKSARNKPSVLFKAFGERGLVFHLNCLIKDATKKSTVQSDLYFAILKLFNEHHIELAAPQSNVIQVNWNPNTHN
ncbi:MAG: portal protein [Gammaproteobacteria bacterium]|nr:portal protein [Gammaproteobacteria bacterium]